MTDLVAKLTYVNIDSIVRHEIERRAEWITTWFGDRCEDMDPGCIICRLWTQHDVFVKSVLCGPETCDPVQSLVVDKAMDHFKSHGFSV